LSHHCQGQGTVLTEQRQGTVLTEQKQGTVLTWQRQGTILAEREILLPHRLDMRQFILGELPPVTRLHIQRLDLAGIADAAADRSGVTEGPHPVVEERAVEPEHAPILDQHQGHVARLRPVQALGHDDRRMHVGYFQSQVYDSALHLAQQL